MVRASLGVLQTSHRPRPFTFSLSLSFHLSAAKRVRSDQLLNRLPKVFIKDGHVVDVRSPLGGALQVTKC